MKNQSELTEQELLVQILSQLKELTKKLPDSNSPAQALGVMDTADLIQLLKITPRTAVDWRKRNILPYTKVGGKFFYLIKDVQEMMQKRFGK